MNTFNLKIASPEGEIFKGNAYAVYLRGSEGDLAVMAGHIPFVTSVVECDCKVELPDGGEKTGHLSGGILTVSKDETVLLSDSFHWN